MLIKSCCLLLLIFSECLTTKITLLDVPAEIRLGDPETEDIILDCQYELESDEGLVVMWNFNNDRVYQWIEGSLPSAISPFKEHLQLDYNISGMPTQQYRAMRLLNLDSSFSGEYECKVSTFVSEDVQKTYMQLYDPGVGPTLAYTLDAGNDTDAADDDAVVVQCGAVGVFPLPDLTLLVDGEIVNQTQSNSLEDGVYNSTATASLPASSLSDGTELRCDLTLPHTTYNNTELLAYQGGASAGSVSARSGLLAALAVPLCHLLQYQRIMNA